MVLESRPTSQGIRFIAGVCIIALSIYGFYITLAWTNSPELFLVPVSTEPGDLPCTPVVFPGISLCGPSELHYALEPDGALRISSSKARIRGEVRVLEKLPREEQWRASLRRPLIRSFLGDEGSMGTHDLMERILSHRFNPTLMGAKAQILPSWMKRDKSAEILVPSGDQAFLFYTSRRFLGITFTGGKTAVISCSGAMSRDEALRLFHSVEITSPERP